MVPNLPGSTNAPPFFLFLATPLSVTPHLPPFNLPALVSVFSAPRQTSLTSGWELKLSPASGWVLFTFESILVLIPVPGIWYGYPTVPFFRSLTFLYWKKIIQFQPVESFTSRGNLSRLIFLITMHITSFNFIYEASCGIAYKSVE